jgi:hypothetical protein
LPADAERFSYDCLGVIRSLEPTPRTWYTLSNAGSDHLSATLVKVHAQRQRIEQMLQEAKGETGLHHYEVRSWVGWHHHMTLSLLALWFLQLQRQRLGKKTPALTVQQVRQIFSRLLHDRSSTAAEIALEITRVLHRNVEARIYHWHQAIGRYPPHYTPCTRTSNGYRRNRN